ncbi:MAG TPA: hypothetical protein VH417_17005 [Vicinamibacterales bacterium]|jgi:hypothetical protein
MSRGALVACGIVAAVVVLAEDADAQITNRLALGANFNTAIAAAPDNTSASHVGFQWRLGHSEGGWGWRFGFNWYSTDIGARVVDSPVELGELHVRPIMIGYGYTHKVRRVAMSANLLAGYAFNKFSLGDRASAVYRVATGNQPVSSGAQNTVVVFPELSMWRDINRRVGLNVSVGYMFARPEVSVETTGGTYHHSVRADTVRIKVGAVYSIF